MNPPTPSSRAAQVAVASAIVAGCALRLSGLEVHSLWFDEGHTTFLASLPQGELLQQLHGDRHPPLSFLAFHAWSALFGNSDVALRMLPALLSCISLGLFAWLSSKWLEPGAKTCAHGLYSFAPFHLAHATEVRMYAFVEVGALLALC